MMPQMVRSVVTAVRSGMAIRAGPAATKPTSQAALPPARSPPIFLPSGPSVSEAKRELIPAHAPGADQFVDHAPDFHHASSGVPMVDDTDDGQIGRIIRSPSRIARRGGPDTNHPIGRDAADGIDRHAARFIWRFWYDKQRTLPTAHGMLLVDTSGSSYTHDLHGAYVLNDRRQRRRRRRCNAHRRPVHSPQSRN